LKLSMMRHSKLVVVALLALVTIANAVSDLDSKEADAATREAFKKEEFQKRILREVGEFEAEHFTSEGKLYEYLDQHKGEILQRYNKWQEENFPEDPKDTELLTVDWFFHHSKKKDDTKIPSEILNDLKEEALNMRATAEDFKNLRLASNATNSNVAELAAEAVKTKNATENKAKSLAHNAAKIATMISRQAIEDQINVKLPKCNLESNEIVEFCPSFKTNRDCKNKLVFGYNHDSLHYYVPCNWTTSADNTSSCEIGASTTGVCRIEWDGNLGSDKCKCKNGWCAEGTTDVCTCHTGYTGDLCDAMTACFKHCDFGWCDDVGVCNCNHGYTGAHCNVEYQDPCLTSCENGFCEEGECICRMGWTGDNCDTSVKTLVSIPCHGCQHGLCELDKSPPKCACNEGWLGNNCDFTDSCMATCVNGYCNSGDCVCNDGHSGDDCSVSALF